MSDGWDVGAVVDVDDLGVAVTAWVHEQGVLVRRGPATDEGMTP